MTTAVQSHLSAVPAQPLGPVVLNCISGGERSGLLALSVAQLLATRLERPALISE